MKTTPGQSRPGIFFFSFYVTFGRFVPHIYNEEGKNK